MLPASVISQNMSVQLDVNPQVETMVEQSLDFGQLITGSGFKEIPLGSPSMGIFQVRALRTQQLMISLDADSTLRHSNPAISDVIFMNLNANYTDNDVNDYRSSLPFSNIVETIVMQSPPHNPDAVWSSIYICIWKH